MTLEQIQEKADSFFDFPTENKDHVTTTSAVLFARECCKEAIAELEAAILKTLNENGHLADGDVCTLIDLKRAMSTWELE